MKEKRNKVPRIIYLKMAYGDDYIDYIKDEYGVENFLSDILKKEDEKTNFLKDNPDVKEFSVNWFILTDYYKSKFGKRIRDKNAIDNLMKIRGFKTLAKIYEFRCNLFKADFILNDKFKQNLSKNLILLRRITSRLLLQKQKKNDFLIKNKEW